MLSTARLVLNASHVCLQFDDPLDAIAVHAWNGIWGVLSVGFFASRELIFNAFGISPQTSDIRPYGCFLGGGGLLLASQICYVLWVFGARPPSWLKVHVRVCMANVRAHLRSWPI